MDTLKKVVGAGGDKKEQLSGQEPVSGVQGAGTAGQPFDAGNEQGNGNLAGKAPQQTNSDVKASGQEPISGVQGAGTAGEPFDAGNLDAKSELAGKAPQRTDLEPETPTKKTEQQSTSASPESTTSNGTPKLEKKPTIGSSGWFANPFAPKKSSGFEGPERDPFASDFPATEEVQSTSEPKTTTTTKPEAPTTSGAERIPEQQNSTSLPPNHLGEDVPPGQDTIVVEPTSDPAFTASGNMPNHLGDDVPPSHTAPMDKGKGKAKMTPEQAEQHERDFPSQRTESSSISTRRESVSTQYTVGTRFTHSTAPTGTSIAGSSRRASAAVHIVTSQGKPITAGGVPLGLPAMEERERRLSFSVPEEDDFTVQESKKTIPTSGIDGTKHHDFASKPAPVAEKSTPATGRDAPPTSKTQTTESKTTDNNNLRRRSSIIVRAKDFGRRMRNSISK